MSDLTNLPVVPSSGYPCKNCKDLPDWPTEPTRNPQCLLRPYLASAGRQLQDGVSSLVRQDGPPWAKALANGNDASTPIQQDQIQRKPQQARVDR